MHVTFPKILKKKKVECGNGIAEIGGKKKNSLLFPHNPNKRKLIVQVSEDSD